MNWKRRLTSQIAFETETEDFDGRPMAGFLPFDSGSDDETAEKDEPGEFDGKRKQH